MKKMTYSPPTKVRGFKMDTKKQVKKLFEKLLSQKSSMYDMALHTKIIASLTREEMSVMYKYK